VDYKDIITKDINTKEESIYKSRYINIRDAYILRLNRV